MSKVNVLEGNDIPDGWNNFLLKSVNIYEYLDCPQSFYGWCYHLTLIFLNCIYQIVIMAESANGPNQYVDRPNLAKYSHLPDATGYFIIKLITTLPLIFHCVTRLIIASYLYIFVGHSEESSSYSFPEFFKKRSNLYLSIWFIPSIISYINPNYWPEDQLYIFHIIDFMRHLQFLQCLKNVPSFYVIKETLSKVAHLVPIPVFIFFCFNIFFGLILYVADPCFNYDSCPFQTLFDATFFSVVTMTTTGYGNQVPTLVQGRLTAFAIMLFGAPYMAIPLGIIDAEFGKAWKEYFNKQKEKEKYCIENGVEIDLKVSTANLSDNNVFAGDDTVPSVNVKTVMLVSTITERLLVSKKSIEVLLNDINPIANEISVISLIVSMTSLFKKISVLCEDLIAIEISTLTPKKVIRNKTPNTSSSKLVKEKTSFDSSKNRNSGLFAANEEANYLFKIKKEAVENPFKYAMRMLLDVPTSSIAAQILNIAIYILIILSVALLYWQTMLTYIPHGENSRICAETIEVYCSNKNDPILNSGCYVTSTLIFSHPIKLNFDCDGPYCYGVNDNFGNLIGQTCYNDYNGYLRPFQEQDQLKVSTWLDSRLEFQQNFDVCHRRECVLSPYKFDAQYYWLVAEIILNTIFTIEIFCRIYISDSLKQYFKSIANWFDLLSIFPFFVELGASIIFNEPMNFRFISSDPTQHKRLFSKILKMMRLFKLVRRFSGTQIIIHVVKKCYRELLRFYSFYILIAACASVILFSVNGSTRCFKGDGSCPVEFEESDEANFFQTGEMIRVTSKGTMPMFYNSMYSMWFTIVTMCTVGFGEIVPVELPEFFIAIVLMLFGSFFVAIPLSIVTRHFSASYDTIMMKQETRLQQVHAVTIKYRPSFFHGNDINNKKDELEKTQASYVNILERARVVAQKSHRRVSKAVFGETKKKSLGDIIKNHKAVSMKNLNVHDNFKASAVDKIKEIVSLRKLKKKENVSTLLRFYKCQGNKLLLFTRAACSLYKSSRLNDKIEIKDSTNAIINDMKSKSKFEKINLNLIRDHMLEKLGKKEQEMFGFTISLNKTDLSDDDEEDDDEEEEEEEDDDDDDDESDFFMRNKENPQITGPRFVKTVVEDKKSNKSSVAVNDNNDDNSDSSGDVDDDVYNKHRKSVAFQKVIQDDNDNGINIDGPVAPRFSNKTERFIRKSKFPKAKKKFENISSEVDEEKTNNLLKFEEIQKEFKLLLQNISDLLELFLHNHSKHGDDIHNLCGVASYLNDDSNWLIESLDFELSDKEEYEKEIDKNNNSSTPLIQTSSSILFNNKVMDS